MTVKGEVRPSHACKICHRKKRSEWVARNREKVNQKKREANKKNPERNRQKAREWREKNPERFKQWGIEYRKRTKEQAKHRDVEWRYGLPREEYKAAMERQGGKCAICKKSRTSTKRSLHVDHCHQTGAFRGLLCSRCNSGIGQFGDDPKMLARAIAYLTLGAENMPDE